MDGMSKNRRPRKNDMRDQLLLAFHKNGISRFEWARQANIGYAAVHGFCSGERDVTLSTASRLADVLGLELRPKRKEE